MAITWADKNAVEVELNKYMADGRDEIDDAVIDRAIKRAEQLIKAKLVNVNIPIPLPDELLEAGTLFAIARGLDIVQTMEDGRSSTAIQNDKDAYAILDGYIWENPDVEAGIEIDLFSMNGSTLDDKEDEVFE
jgi:hypothetical protein